MIKEGEKEIDDQNHKLKIADKFGFPALDDFTKEDLARDEKEEKKIKALKKEKKEKEEKSRSRRGRGGYGGVKDGYRGFRESYRGSRGALKDKSFYEGGEQQGDGQLQEQGGRQVF